MMNQFPLPTLAVIPIHGGPEQLLFDVIIWCFGVVPILVYLLFLVVLIKQRCTRITAGHFAVAARLIGFRLCLEALAWLLGLALFSVISLAFVSKTDFGFLLPPFFLTLYALRTYAWWIVGGKGLSFFTRYIHVEGLGLHSKALFSWTSMGLVLCIATDIIFFVSNGWGENLLGINLGKDFVRIWKAPY